MIGPKRDGYKFNLKNAKIALWDGTSFGSPETWKDIPDPVSINFVYQMHLLHLGVPLAVDIYHFEPIGDTAWTWVWYKLNHAQRRFLRRAFLLDHKPHSRKVQHNIDRKIARMLRKANNAKSND